MPQTNPNYTEGGRIYTYLGNIKGDKGNNGPQSNTINIVNNKSLVIDPSETGEYLLDTSDSNLYCSINGSWGSPICNLKGEPGVTGASPELVKFYIDPNTGNLFVYVSQPL